LKYLKKKLLQMNNKNITLFILLIFLLESCGTWDSVKRGLTGQKAKSGDEFLVEKKDPLILPPDFEKLPTPDERVEAEEEMSSFEKKLEISTLSEDDDMTSDDSTEESILKQIRKQ